MKITVLSGGVGGARFLRGLRAAAVRDPSVIEPVEITAIVNVGDDMWMSGVRICPDLDSIMYTLAGQNDEERGWGRVGESSRVSEELRAYGVGWPWFTLGDLDLGTHLARTSMLRDGLTLSSATARIASRWDLGVRLLPATNQEVETHVLTMERTMHFQEWWTRYRAAVPALSFEYRGAASSVPAPSVVEALETADVILIAPSNPVVSIGPILAIPGILSAVQAASAPVVGISPIINGAVVRGMADACLTAIGVSTSASAVALHYGSRTSGGLLDGWLVDVSDSPEVELVEALGIRTRAVPLWMRDPESSAQVARDALALAR